MVLNGNGVEDYIRRARLFVSCASADQEAARLLVRELENHGYHVEWHQTFPAGINWRRSIEAGISTAYAIVVLWTPAATQSQWVQSEIGFARGRCIPIFVVREGGSGPEGMSSEIQHLERTNVLQRIPEDLPRLLESAAKGAVPMQIARYPEERTDWLGRQADEIDEPQLIRQIATFSSFAIPYEHPEHSPARWNARDGGSRTTGHRSKQCQERRALQSHAEGRGARVIIAPRVLRRGQVESRARLEVLREFLIGPASKRVSVAIADSVPRGNLTSVGDRFLCESQAPGRHGFAYTSFTSHAPTVLGAIAQFDLQFRSIDTEAEHNVGASRTRAAERIDKLLGALGRDSVPEQQVRDESD